MDIRALLEDLVKTGMVQLNQPAHENEIAETEKKIGRDLPEDVKQLFLASNGLTAFFGSLKIYPLSNNDDFCLSNAANSHRSWDWIIPNEMVIFGDNGSASPYGFWINKKSIEKCIIVQTAEIFEEKSLTIISSSLYKFILLQSAIFIKMINPEKIGIIQKYVDISNVEMEYDDEQFTKTIRDKIDPTLSRLAMDPYADLLSPKDINIYEEKSFV